MSQTLLTAVPPRAQLTFSDTTQTWTEIFMPPWARTVELSAPTNNIEYIVDFVPGVVEAGASDAGDNDHTLLADGKITISLTAGRGNKEQARVFIRAPTNPTTIEVAVNEATL